MNLPINLLGGRKFGENYMYHEVFMDIRLICAIGKQTARCAKLLPLKFLSSDDDNGGSYYGNYDYIV